MEMIMLYSVTFTVYNKYFEIKVIVNVEPKEAMSCLWQGPHLQNNKYRFYVM